MSRRLARAVIAAAAVVVTAIPAPLFATCFAVCTGWVGYTLRADGSSWELTGCSEVYCEDGTVVYTCFYRRVD